MQGPTQTAATARARLGTARMRLVRETPGDDRGMRLVALHELARHLATQCEAPFEPARFEEQAHRRRLGNHEKAQAIGELELLVGVRVMRRAKRVGSDPAHERVVFDDDRRHETATGDWKVLVSAETSQVDGSIVDEQPRSVDAHRTKADGDAHSIDDRFVTQQLDHELVQVGFARRPEARARNVELELGASVSNHGLFRRYRAMAA